MTFPSRVAKRESSEQKRTSGFVNKRNQNGFVAVTGPLKSGGKPLCPQWCARRTAGSWRRARMTRRCGSGTRQRVPASTRSRATWIQFPRWSTRPTAGSWRRARWTTRCGSGTRPQGPVCTRSRERNYSVFPAMTPRPAQKAPWHTEVGCLVSSVWPIKSEGRTSDKTLSQKL